MGERGGIYRVLVGGGDMRERDQPLGRPWPRWEG